MKKPSPFQSQRPVTNIDVERTIVDYSAPLTPEQQAFAEENHDLIYEYMNKYHLPHSEYYGLISIGMIRAVQAWFQSEYVRTFKFSTIAFWNMKGVVYRYHRDVSKHHIEASSLDVESNFEDNRISRMARVPDWKMEAATDFTIFKVVLEELITSPRQREIIRMLSEGYVQREIADRFGVTQVQVSRDIAKIRERLRQEYLKVI